MSDSDHVSVSALRGPAELPMFPLGSVLFPSMILPLRLFEPRYLDMIEQVMAGDGRFGVTLIERGSEVGGGDARSTVGCAAQILQAEAQDDGQWFVVAVGTVRLKVDEWLPDAPWPRAVVMPWSDVADDEPDATGAELAARIASLTPLFRRVLALAAEADEWSVPLTIELSEDPVMAGYQMSAVSPFGSFDRQRLLAASHPLERCEVLLELLGEAETDFRARLAS